MTAMSIAKLALKYETKDKEKEKAVLKYLEKIKSVTDYLDFLYKGCKEKVLTKKIEEFDEYIGKSLIILLEKPSDLSLHYYLLGFPYRFEGYFIN